MQPKLYRLYWVFGWLFDFTKLLTIVIVYGLIFHFFILTLNIVQGESMSPNFVDGNIVLVDRLTSHWRPYERGEVVSFNFPGAENRKFIKRIIGLPNEQVVIENGVVKINNEPLNESYLPAGSRTFPNTAYTLAPGEYFVLGDARTNSLDSRQWGGLPQSYLIGRVMTRVEWPHDITLQSVRATLQMFWKLRQPSAQSAP